jgi:tRNA-2-methylthio-N6-dimethylallyladenosine synthase
MKQKKYHITTFGCQANLADTEKISDVFETFGHLVSKSAEDADFLIFNTCSVKQKAEDRVFGLNKKLRDLKAKNHNLKTVLTGCMLHYSEEELRRRLPYIDHFMKIKDIKKLPKILELGKVKLKSSSTPDFRASSKSGVFPDLALGNRVSKLITIMDGCNNFCSYCIVPYSRGREVSRSVKDILKEVKNAVTNNAKEIWLLGQNVNSYKSEFRISNFDSNSNLEIKELKIDSKFKIKNSKFITFPDLLRLVSAVPGDFWIRFTSPHPKDFLALHSSSRATDGTDDMIKAMKESEKCPNYLHLPLQSGNNDILKKMNRPYTIEHYKNLVKKIRKAMPDISLSTDIIVGFPGETKKQFNDTLKVVKELEFDMIFISEYSPRSKTLAAEKYKDDVSHEEKELRKEKINTVLKKTALKNNKKLIGKTVKVLVAAHGEPRPWRDSKKGGKFYGRTGGYKLVEIATSEKNDLVGKFINVKIIEAGRWRLKGKLL